MRLTKETKEDIRDQVIAKTFVKRDEELAADHVQIGETIYHRTCGDHVTAMYAVPKGFYPEFDAIHCNFAGIGGYGHNVPMKESRRLPYNNSSRHKFEADDPITLLYSEYMKKLDKLNDDKNTLRRQIKALLEPITTVKRLLEAWPEAVEYLPTESKPAPPPAIIGEDINKLILSLKQ